MFFRTPEAVIAGGVEVIDSAVVVVIRFVAMEIMLENRLAQEHSRQE